MVDLIVNIQERFGGIEYRVPHSEIGFHLGILPDWDYDVFGFEEGGRYFFECGWHPIAQVRFYLDQEGIMYVKPDVLIPIASSIEKYIESDALMYDMFRESSSPLLPVGWRLVHEGVFDRDDKRINARVHLPTFPEASDEYTTWWGQGGLRVQRAAYWEWGHSPHRDDVRTFARSWRDVLRVREMFRGIQFCE